MKKTLLIFALLALLITGTVSALGPTNSIQYRPVLKYDTMTIFNYLGGMSSKDNSEDQYVFHNILFSNNLLFKIPTWERLSMGPRLDFSLHFQPELEQVYTRMGAMYIVEWYPVYGGIGVSSYLGDNMDQSTYNKRYDFSLIIEIGVYIKFLKHLSQSPGVDISMGFMPLSFVDNPAKNNVVWFLSDDAFIYLGIGMQF